MVKTLVIGDLHFDCKDRNLLKSQVDTVKRIATEALWRDDIDQCIFLGDLMMHRRPSPAVLLALKDVIEWCESKFKQIYILRGNHDSMTKADDGVTALSLFSNPIEPKTTIITQTFFDDKYERVFIPHYEDERRIKEYLSQVPRGYAVFGHFGYHGALNSAGDADFGLRVSDFRNTTVLGHIHKATCTDKITVLGTPYTTNFGEAGKDCYYGVIERNSIERFPIEFGPRHLVLDYDSVEENLDWINAPEFYTMLRINVNTLSESQDAVAHLIDKLDVGKVEVKYKPLFDDKDEFDISSNTNVATDLSDELIEEYINSSSSKIGKEELMKGLSLIYENQRSRNQ
jgi:DNA repair exonuclease SbcCD nuclease subunit